MKKWKIPKKVLQEGNIEYKVNTGCLDPCIGRPFDQVLFDALKIDTVITENTKYGDLNYDFELEEGLIKTFPADQVWDRILHLFPEMGASQVQIVNIPEGGEKFKIEDWVGLFVSDNGDNTKRLTNLMETCGYTLQANIGHKHSKVWRTLYFSPNHQVPRDMEDELYLWHISPKKYEQSILKKGFVPYKKNSKFKYPDRIYFFKGSVPKSTVIKEGVKLYLSQVEKAPEEYVDPTMYVLYQVALYRMVNYKFYSDPDWPGIAVYTTDNIPPSLIDSREDVSYKDMPKVNSNQKDV